MNENDALEKKEHELLNEALLLLNQIYDELEEKATRQQVMFMSSSGESFLSPFFPVFLTGRELNFFQNLVEFLDKKPAIWWSPPWFRNDNLRKYCVWWKDIDEKIDKIFDVRRKKLDELLEEMKRRRGR
jgi:hypothetical protein